MSMDANGLNLFSSTDYSSEIIPLQKWYKQYLSKKHRKNKLNNF